MNPTTATIDECRDYIAKCKGWSVTEDGIWFRSDWPDPNDAVRCVRAGLLPRYDHPVSSTLDAAHDSLPEGWEWDSIVRCVSDYATYKYFSADVLDVKRDIYAEADAEGHSKESMLLAMFRASAAAWAQVKGEQA